MYKLKEFVISAVTNSICGRPATFTENPYMNVMAYMVLAIAVFAAYANVYANPFFYDDLILVTGNQLLRSWSYLSSLFYTLLPDGNNHSSSYFRPVQMLLYLILFQAGGLSLAAFHGLNIALHAANACLVFKLGRKLQFKWLASFLAALLWAVHPVQTEAVTYISATADPLYSFFCLLGIIVLLPDFSSRRLLLVILLMILGLLSKESALSVPFLAMACLYFRNDRRFELKPYLRLWPLVALCAIYAGFRYYFLPHIAGLPKAQAPLAVVNFAAFATLPYYLRFMLPPYHLHMEHDLSDYATIWHAGVLAGIGMSLAAFWQILRPQSERSLPFSWGIGWFVAALLPTFLTEGVFYEHWLYLASAGLFLGVAQSLTLCIERLPGTYPRLAEKTVVILALLAIVFAGLATWRQNMVWRDPVAFYLHTIDQGEPTPKMHTNLGALYIGQGKYAAAIEQNRLAITNSQDTIAAAEANLGIALLLSDAQSTEGIEHLQRALEIDPAFYPALEALAMHYAEQGNTEEARLYQDKADQARQK
jgi:tetratricopeptide (TPR) repeat protein